MAAACTHQQREKIQRVVSQSRGPHSGPQIIIVLIMGIPKTVPLILGNPQMYNHVEPLQNDPVNILLIFRAAPNMLAILLLKAASSGFKSSVVPRPGGGEGRQHCCRSRLIWKSHISVRFHFPGEPMY